MNIRNMVGYFLLFGIIVTAPVFLSISFFFYAMHPANSWSMGEKPVFQLATLFIYLLVLGIYGTVKYKIAQTGIILIKNKELGEIKNPSHSKLWGFLSLKLSNWRLQQAAEYVLNLRNQLWAILFALLAINVLFIGITYVPQPAPELPVGGILGVAFQFHWLLVIISFLHYAIPSLLLFEFRPRKSV